MEHHWDWIGSFQTLSIVWCVRCGAVSRCIVDGEAGRIRADAGERIYRYPGSTDSPSEWTPEVRPCKIG